MPGTEDGGKRPSILLATLKTVVVVGLLSYAATVWLSTSGLDQGGLARLAATATGSDDPVTTGSLSRGAASARLDPCVVPRR